VRGEDRLHVVGVTGRDETAHAVDSAATETLVSDTFVL
jgi:hypothetical protein